MISLNKGMVLLFLIRCCLFALGLLLVMCLLEFTKVSVLNLFLYFGWISTVEKFLCIK